MNSENTINYSDEIDLIYYINFILKRKWRFLFLFIIGGIVGSSLGPMALINKGETAIELGTIYKYDKNSLEYIEPPFNLALKIENGFYGNYGNIRATWFENSNLIKIEIISDKSPSQIKNILSNINNSILEDHKKILKEQEKIFNKAIAEVEKIVNLQKLERKETESSRLKIFSFQTMKDSFIPTKVFKEPIVTEKTNNLISYPVSFILAGFLLIILSFIFFSLQEWWRKNRREIKF